MIRELRALIVQLYALRDSDAKERGPIIEALAKLYPTRYLLRKQGPPPTREESEPPGPDRET